MKELLPLPPSQLCTQGNAEELRSDHSEQTQSKQIRGHQRAEDALRFGMGMTGPGYNVFVLGQYGSGMVQAVKQMLLADCASRPAPDDCCYVNNFQNPAKPRLLQLPSGRGLDLQASMAQLIEDLQVAIVASFDTEEYHAKVSELEEEIETRQRAALEHIGEEARRKNISMIRTPGGYGFAPLGAAEEVITPEEYGKLPEKEQRKIQDSIEELQPMLQKVVHQFPAWQKELRRCVKALNEDTARSAINSSIATLREQYAGLERVQHYLDEVEKDVIENFEDFRPSEQQNSIFSFAGSRHETLRRYAVNTLLDQSELECAPVVEEDLPTHSNLLGCIEHIAQMGTLTTDFTLVKAGALHRANGGYLILDARQLLTQPFAYDSLKRALKSNEIKIESLENRFGMISTVSLEPEPMPINLKVILTGEHYLYYLLSAYDPEFQDLFKVSADFDDRIERNEENSNLLAGIVNRLSTEQELLPCDTSGLSKIIERSARMAGDSEKLTMHMRDIGELVQESDYWARDAGRKVISSADVEKTIEQQVYRSDRIRERLYENIDKATVLIDTSGVKIGQINALSVIQLGKFAFGQPSRITATVRLGAGNIVDIERETELGGPLHSKGVLILSGFLGSRYAQHVPLSLAASLVFEQSYGGVDGDSASLAELCALLSALAKLPIDQKFALTGSVNQHGQVQAIGGVNEKIEGFFDVCKRRGLAAGQAVLIPAANVRHLMLRADVLEAVERGEFNVYAVESVDEAMALLTDTEAGELLDGQYPSNTINRMVQDRISKFADARAAFASQRESNAKH